MAVLTEAIEAGEGAEAVRATDAVLVEIAMVTTIAPAVTSTVAEDVLALVRAPLMTATTALRVESVTRIDVAAVTVMVAALAPIAEMPANPQNSTRMNVTREPFLCNSLPLVCELKS